MIDYAWVILKSYKRSQRFISMPLEKNRVDIR